MSEKKKVALETGKRKTAVARAIVKPGKGRIYINDISLEYMSPEVARMKIQEPLMIAGDRSRQVDIRVNVEGGGVMGQAEAARIAIARALAGWTKSTELRKSFMAFDRVRNRTGDKPRMIIPVRCFTCGKQIADKWETFNQRVRAGDKPQKVLDELGLRRYCCRRMMITHVEIIDEFLKYAQVTAKRRSELA